jgi:hypothetical protein
MLTDRLDKSPTVRDRFDKFIRTFYQRFGDKKGIKIHQSRIDFYGFGHFYIDEGEIGSSTAEMGHTISPEGKSVNLTSTNGGPFEVTYYPMEIDLNQIYLLNHGTIEMDRFYRAEPSPNNGGFAIDFDHLIETIAHEIAHAVQNVKNIDKGRKSTYQPGSLVFSQCASSGEREGRNPDGNLLYPD